MPRRDVIHLDNWLAGRCACDTRKCKLNGTPDAFRFDAMRLDARAAISRAAGARARARLVVFRPAFRLDGTCDVNCCFCIRSASVPANCARSRIWATLKSSGLRSADRYRHCRTSLPPPLAPDASHHSALQRTAVRRNRRRKFIGLPVDRPPGAGKGRLGERNVEQPPGLFRSKLRRFARTRIFNDDLP